MHVLPLLPALLHDEDEPFPLYALELAALLTKARPGWVAKLDAAAFFEFLDVGHALNTAHNVALDARSPLDLALTLTRETIVVGFRAAGIWPFDPSKGLAHVTPATGAAGRARGRARGRRRSG